MKLATLKDGSRDGKLVVVSRDLTRYTDASFLAPTLQAALDDWRRISPHLQTLAESLETGSVPSLRFHEHDAQSPLPRVYQHSGGIDAFTGPRDAIAAADDEASVGFAATVAVITGDLPMGATADHASEAILLVALCGSTTHQEGAPGLHGSGMASCSPVAVTPDELGSAWTASGAALPLLASVGGKPAKPLAGVGNAGDFAGLVAAAARSRPLSAGAIVEARAGGFDPMTLGVGDTVRIEMKDAQGRSIFGAIEKTVQKQV